METMLILFDYIFFLFLMRKTLKYTFSLHFISRLSGRNSWAFKEISLDISLFYWSPPQSYDSLLLRNGCCHMMDLEMLFFSMIFCSIGANMWTEIGNGSSSICLVPLLTTPSRSSFYGAISMDLTVLVNIFIYRLRWDVEWINKQVSDEHTST